MASLADLIRISAGDPMGMATAYADRASQYYSQYESEVDDIEEINEAIRIAQEAANKNKGLYALGGGALDLGLSSLMNFVLPGMGEVTKRIVQGAIGAASAGAAEKYRQDRYNVTESIEDLKEKFKDTKFEDNLATTLEILEGGLGDAVMGSAMKQGMASAAMPTNLGNTKLGEVVGEGADAETMNLFSGAGSVGESLVDMLMPIPGLGEAFGEMQSGSGGGRDFARILARYGYNPIMQEMSPEYVIDDYYLPEFTNPYR